MSYKQATDFVFRHHCPSDLPFFCNFGSVGSDFHRHVDFYEFCIIVSGSYRHIHHREETIFDLGQLLFFSPGETHALFDLGPSSHHYSFIVEEHYFQQYVSKHIDYAEQVFNTPYLICKLPSLEFAYLTHLTSIIVRSASTDRLPIADHLLSNLLFSCFAAQLEPISNAVQIYAVDLLRRFDSYHELNTDINTLYEDYPVSPTTLIHDFKELTGQTIVQYRNAKRIEYAAQLLKEENYPTAMIANMLNISSLGYFSNQFKKQYGMTPKQYQILYRKNRQ